MTSNDAYNDEIRNIIDELMYDYSDITVRDFLSCLGLIPEIGEKNRRSFHKYVFLEGDIDEIFSQEERAVIERVTDFCSFKDYYKRTKKGRMQVRMYHLDLSVMPDDVYIAIAVMKIINKITNSFNIFLFKMQRGYSFGIRLFETQKKDDCVLSYPGDFDRVVDDIYWMKQSADFVDFYLQIKSALMSYTINEYRDYDEEVILRRGFQSKYIEEIKEVGRIYELDTDREIERYMMSFEVIDNTGDKDDFHEAVQYYMNSINSEKHASFNTLEMLFNADEMEKFSEEKYQKNIISSGETIEQKDNNVLFEQYKDDPEELIKALKKIRGI